jgi:asparagine synthase (glutamine-hydrolysing)
MHDTVRHRGPDDCGVWSSPDGAAVFGHRRLAIIDLSPGGHQPMGDPQDRHVVFNGEIYNFKELRHELEGLGHQFRTASDTEVLLAAYARWGTDCVSRLNGMFAFAIYDHATRRVFAARDRAGEKPFFYRHAAGRFTFASELKALLAEPGCARVIDRDALEFYLAYAYVPGDRCILQGYRKLPQGHALTYDVTTDSVRTWAYWKLPDPEATGTPDAELIEQLEALLLDSVRLRLIADVPVGVLLSGGIDSSLITAMAARVSRKVKTFTISFPGYGAYDEAPFARMVARHFGTDHVELAAEPATVALLPALARQYDEPIGDSSMVPTYLVSALIRREATVALGGDGGDELFGGYPHYSWLQSQARIRALVPRTIRPYVGAGASKFLPVGLRGRNYLIGITSELPLSVAQFNLYFDARTRRQLLAPMGPYADPGAPERFKANLVPRGHSILQQAAAVDFQTYLVDDILVKVDRASMLCSLEIRAPWLDPRLIDFAFRRVPDRLRATGRERKVLPRALAARLLPPSLDLTRKQGFSLPLQAWFKGEWGAYVREILAGADPALFDRRTIQSLIQGQRKGYSNTPRLFALAIFELWRREYGVTAG